MELTRHPYPWRLGVWLGFVGLFATAAYAAYFTRPDERNYEPLFEYSTAVGALIGAIVLGGTAVLIAVNGPARELLALRPPASWRRAGLLALALFAVMYVLAALSSVAGLEPGEEQGLLPDRWDADRAVPFLLNAAAIVIAAPVVEELLFRGIGFSLLRPFGAGVAIVAVGVLFAASHGLVEAFPLLAVFGAGLAYIRERTGSIYPPILLHALFNGLSLLLALTLGGG